MQEVKTEQQFREIIAADEVTMMVFKTNWCKDCHYIEPFMPELVDAYQGRITFYQVDRDDLPDICEEYNVLGIPSFIAFKQGKELVRFVSKLRKTKEEIAAFFDRTVEVANAIEKS